RYLNPPPQGETRKWKQQETSWKRRAEDRKRKEKDHRDNWRKYLSENIDKIRDPGLPTPYQISNAQYYLHERMREKDSGLNRWTDADWKCLIDEQGEAVARAFRDGAVAYWRRYKPKLRSEGAPLNQTPFPVIFGLTGLSIEARESSGWFDSLNEE